MSLERASDMNTATAMMEQQHRLLRYRGQARRHLYERDRLREATEDELQSLAEAFMHEDFKRQIEPYERARNKLLSDFYMLQVNPHAQMSKELTICVKQWNEQIEAKAREFGYQILDKTI